MIVRTFIDVSAKKSHLIKDSYVVAKGIDNVFNLATFSIGELVQCTHSPVFIGTNGSNATRSATVQVSLQHTTDDIDILGLVDKDGMSLAPMFECDPIRVFVMELVAGIS